MLLATIVFLIGLYFYSCYAGSLEGFDTLNKPRCPDMLVQEGSRFYLYNSKLARVPGVNPIEFETLEDYTEFLEWQRSQGIKCPVLYLQSTYDTQGDTVYKARPSVTEPQAGLPPSPAAPVGIASQVPPTLETSLTSPNPTQLVDATRNDPPYNGQSYPAYDQTSYYVGATTPLDAMDAKQEQAGVSPNPMDPNWGGAAYTQSLVDQGYYKDNEVSIAVP